MKYSLAFPLPIGTALVGASMLVTLAGCATPEVLTQPPVMPTMPVPMGTSLPFPVFGLASGETPAVLPLAPVAVDAAVARHSSGLPVPPPAPRLADLPGDKSDDKAAGTEDEIADLLASDPQGPRAGTLRLTDGVQPRQDGRWTRRSGNVYQHSDGSSTVRLGDVFFHSDGTWTRRSGNVILRSDGSSCSLSMGTALCQGGAGQGMASRR
jgi:hypothetical protein